MAQWFRYDDGGEGRHLGEDRHERSARGRDDRSWLERGKDEVKSWTRDDVDDDDVDERARYRRPPAEGRVAVSGTRPEWLDRGSRQRPIEGEPRVPAAPSSPRTEQHQERWDGRGSMLSSSSWMVPGPHVGHGPNGYRRSDERILEDVCERLMQHGRIDARNVDVIVSNGEVTLRGSVPSREMKRTAEDVSESVFGVVDVRNEIKTMPVGAAQGAGANPAPIDPRNG